MGLAFGDLKGRFLKMNPALERILKGTLGGNTIIDDGGLRILTTSAKSFCRYFKSFAGKHHHYKTEKRYFHKDGHTVWARVECPWSEMKTETRRMPSA